MLKPEEIIALAGAFKDKAVTDAKAALPDGANCPVAFTVHVSGAVSKGHGTPDVTTTREATCSLASLTVFCAVLRLLGIGPKRLRIALEDLPALSSLQMDEEMTAIFDDVARSIAKRLPPQTVTTNGKRGAVTTAVAVSKVVK